MEIEGAVSQDVEPAATEPTTSPEPSSAAPSEAPARRGTENAIPHYRVEEMRRKDAEKHQAELAALRKQLEQYGGVVNKMNDGFTAFGRGLGFIKDEQPEYLDKKTHEEQLQSLRAEMSSQFEQKLAVRQLQAEWKQASSKHQKWTQVPGFKQACLDQYAETGRDLSEIADEVAGHYAKLFAIQKAEEDAAKATEAAKTKVVKPGGGMGAPAAKAEKGSVASKVMARLRDKTA